MSRLIRLTVLAAVVGAMGLASAACTNTVRGLGRDFNSDNMQNYNARPGAVVIDRY